MEVPFRIDKRRRIWTVQWGNPYTQPPDGRPRVVACWYCPPEQTTPPQILVELAAEMDSGYTFFHDREFYISPNRGKMPRRSKPSSPQADLPLDAL